MVSSQSQIDQLTTHDAATLLGSPTCIQFLLVGGTTYEVNMMKIMLLATNASLIMESKGGAAEINCTADSSDLEELSRTIQPLSRASLVLLDGIVFTGCPAPILLKEVSNVVIQNCVFQ